MEILLIGVLAVQHMVQDYWHFILFWSISKVPCPNDEDALISTKMINISFVKPNNAILKAHS